MRRKGFTLIELLVVVSIIGVLATIIVSSLGGAKDKANNVALLKEAQELQRAIETYTAFEGSYPFSGDELNGPGSAFYVAANCGDYDSSSTAHRNWLDFEDGMGDYLPEHFQGAGGIFPLCLFYLLDNHTSCDADPSSNYNIMFIFEDEIGIQGVDSYLTGTNYQRACIYSL